MRARGLWPSARSLVLPRVCEACGDRAFDPIPLCARCRRALCPAVLPAREEHLEVVAPFSYEGEVSAAIMHRFKFGGARGLATWMARAAAVALRRRGPLEPDVVLCPVPLVPHRRRERGYDQAELIARALSERVNRPWARLLRRVEGRGRQTQRGKRERERALESAFAPEPTNAYLPVVIVDDVCTTGSTIEACRRALESHGHRVLFATTVFYTPSPGSGLCSAKS